MNFVLVWNFAVFLIYGIDKYQSIRKRRRIREAALLAAALFLGGIGALMGMMIFRHKTRKKIFVITVSFSAMLTLSFYTFFLR